jgi:sigma-B regulation protein RsbU (phosphoserine phosphatase)
MDPGSTALPIDQAPPGASARRPSFHSLFDAPWQQRMDFIVNTMRELSRQTDPQLMVQTYNKRMRELLPSDGWMSLSRRGLQRPSYRITRSHLWGSMHDPWQSKVPQVVFDRGLLSELIYKEEPSILHNIELADDDPAAKYFDGMKSLVAIPLFDKGESLNMAIVLRREPDGFTADRLPEHTWMANLFGRATHNLVLSQEVSKAYDSVEKELQVVADIQRSLLPQELPKIPSLQLATHYQTSQRAGGDYYDFFPLDNGKWGILIADVSGHGTPAAVLMAVTHSIAHTHHGEPDPPSKLLTFVNRHLAARYTNGTGTFVTAFYGIYDPATRQLRYARAGHCPPRVKRAAGGIEVIDRAPCLPLGIDPDETYRDDVEQLEKGDALVFYTDGITEARNRAGDMFDTTRLDQVLDDCACDPESIIRRTLIAVERFTDDAAPADDQTLLVAKVR